MSAAAGEGSAPAAELGSPGELLRKERERRMLSVQQAAEDLHLDAATVEAIEADRFQTLGAPVYAKGHLRKYATLLGLPPGLVIERYQALSDTPTEPTPVPASVVGSPALRERRSARLPIGIVTVLVIAGLGWWVFGWLAEPPPEDEFDPTQPSTTAAEPAATEPATTNAPPPVETTGTSNTPVAPQPATTASTNATSAAAGEVQLSLEFSSPSWVEIYDAAGRRLMFDTGAPDHARTVNGAAPVTVTLGYASAVSVRVNDQPIVVPRRGGKDAAKFVIEADGTVR